MDFTSHVQTLSERCCSNFRMLKLQAWVFPGGDGDAERQESYTIFLLNGLLDFSVKKH